MKTVFCFNTFQEAAVFFILEGDYKYLDGIYINSVVEGEEDDKLQDELNQLIYEIESGKYKTEPLKYPPKEYDIWINVGFLP